MTTLSYLNEPGVLYNLKCRYGLDAIYTYTASILIAVNSFANLPHLYGAHMMEQYRGRALGELSPHVYAIADAAYQQMTRAKKSQSILVSISSCQAGTPNRSCCSVYTKGQGTNPSLAEMPLRSRRVHSAFLAH